MTNATNRRPVLAAGALLVLGLWPAALQAQTRSATEPGVRTRDPGFTLEDVLGAPFPYDLVSAPGADRIAWIENERGRRNVYTAAAPDFTPLRLTATTTDDGVDLGSLQISADGRVVVFIRGHTPNRDGWVASPASDPEGGRREVWAATTDGSRPPWRVVSVLEARLSPDGRWVLHLRDGQVHRSPVDPGVAGAAEPAAQDEAPPLFRSLGESSDPVWSPDGRRVAFVTARRDQRRLFPTDGEPPWTHSFVAVYDLDGRTLTYLAPGVDFDSAPVWSPDGSRVAFLRRPGLPFGVGATEMPRGTAREAVPAGFLEPRLPGGSTLAVWVADVETGEAVQLWRNEPGDSLFAELEGLAWAGDHLVFQAEPEGWAHLYALAVEEAAPEPVLLTPGDGEVDHWTFSPDGRRLFYTSNVGDLDRRDLWRVAVGGGPAERLTDGAGIETFPAVLASGEGVAVLQSGPRQPLTVAVVPTGGGEARRVGAGPPPGFPADRHVDPETVVITSADGVRAHSLLFRPPGMQAGERRPALVFVHGGPSMQTVLGYHYQGPHGFYHHTYGVSQYLAAKGYLVLSVNYRAGTGYGRAFREAPELRDRGNAEYRDVLAAGEWLREHPDVDPERIGIWGLSYGGWLTGQALSRDSDLFKAGVDIAGVQYRSTSLDLDPDDLAYQSSPAYNIERWTSPVLIVHGDDDRNVDFSQTIGLVQLLRAQGVPHELIVFPNDTHYFQLFSRWVRTFHALDDFFERTLIRREGVGVAAGGSGPRPR